MKLIYLLLLPCLLLAQAVPPPPPRPLYRDFAATDSLLYFLKRGDTLEIRDIKDHNSIIEIRPGIRAVAKGRAGMYALTSNGTFMTLPGNKNPMPEKPFTLGYPLLLDKDDNPLTLTNGVYYKDSLYIPEKELTRSVRVYVRDDGAFHYPKIIFMDSQQHLWLGYEQGEWGGGYFIFDLNTKQFVNLDENKPIDSLSREKLYNYPELYIRNPRSIAEDAKGTLLFSESLYHFSVSGSLSLVTKNSSGLYEKYTDLREILDYSHKNKKHPRLKEYLGPVAYNPYNKSFYYYSQLGFFRITQNNGTYSKELLFNPDLLFTYGQPHSVGYAMNIEKFRFVAENKLVFLTTENGIGYYNGKEVVYYK